MGAAGRGARAAKTAVGIVTPTLLGVTCSGAPDPAVTGLWLWGIGWIGYGVWISAGHPTAAEVGRAAGRAVELGLRAVTPSVVRARRALGNTGAVFDGPDPTGPAVVDPAGF